MIYTVIFDGGAIATLSNVAHIYDQDKHDILNEDNNLCISFTIWGYSNLDDMNKILDDRGISYSFSKVDYDAGEFTYALNIRPGAGNLKFIKDLLKEKGIDWRIE